MMGESYAKLVIQPIDLIRAFKVDFCLASIIKWLTKWHMERKSECLQRARYYLDLCEPGLSRELYFAIRLYCISNKFMADNSSSCLLESVVLDVMNGERDKARQRLDNASAS